MSESDPSTPVLVGACAVQQKLADYREADEPAALMDASLRGAIRDAGSEALVSRVGEILVPKGIWSYVDPGRLLATSLGCGEADTVLGEIGVSQQALINRACARIASGEIEVALVTGAEAKYRSLCAAKAGEEAPETAQEGVEPTETLVPEQELWSPVESAAGLGMPVGYYAIMDSALRYRQGLTVDQHRDQMAAMYARFSEIAVDNPLAWADHAVSAGQIREHAAANRMLAFPYTKLHNSQWNVDQGAGLVLCSIGVAEELGIPRDKWVFPVASAESNFMSTVASRGDLGGNAGFRLAGRAVMDAAGVTFDDIRLRELYSCFPYAVRVQLQEFGMDEEGDLSVTGGMTFGGGPLNNFVFQATARMAGLLRARPGEKGLVTTVSGMLTKQACALWSTAPNPDGWVCTDVTEQVREAMDVRELVGEYRGEGVVAGYTVLYQGNDAWRAVAIFDLPDGRRTVAFSEQPEILAAMQQRENCGERFKLADGRFGIG